MLKNGSILIDVPPSFSENSIKLTYQNSIKFRSIGNIASVLIVVYRTVVSFICFQCHHLLETHEEDIEEYWFKVFAKKKDKDLNTWLCIERIKGKDVCIVI